MTSSMSRVIQTKRRSQCFLLQLDVEDVVHEYQEARKRLLVFGYNATLTTGVESTPRQPKRHFDNLMVRAGDSWTKSAWVS